jgi:hypothetical protein
MPVTQAGLPIACTLDPVDGRDRMQRWRTLHSLAHPAALRDGSRLELRYAAGAGVYDELTALAAAESECCGFVTWTVACDGDVPILTVTAPGEDPSGLDAIEALLAVDAT